MRNTVKKILFRISPSFFRQIQLRLNMKRLRNERGGGRGSPASHRYKAMLVRHYALSYGIDVLIETGTFRGEMIAATREIFRDIHSVEICEDLYLKAKKRFNNSTNVNLYLGDSGEMLSVILSNIQSPVVVWLDAHYSGDGTGGGGRDAPILKELDELLKYNYPLIILIDDARDFNGHNGYPTIGAVCDHLGCHKFDSFDVENDIVRIGIGIHLDRVR